MNGLSRSSNTQVGQYCFKPTRFRVNRGVDPQSQLRNSFGEVFNTIKSFTISAFGSYCLYALCRIRIIAQLWRADILIVLNSTNDYSLFPALPKPQGHQTIIETIQENPLRRKRGNITIPQFK